MMMTRNSEKLFCSKILLFGEYSIIQNSMALSIPFPLFNGELVFKSRGKDGEVAGNGELLSFSEYLRDLLSQKDLNFSFDLNSFLFDIGQGLVFSSTIPSGFGVGSSGALVAAIFHRYGKLLSPKKELEILQLREVFAKMESHFHGKSSGIDPLISYLNDPLLIRSQKDLGVVRLPSFPENHGAMFLMNTGRPRRTEPLVNLFLEKCKEEKFMEICLREFIPIANECITHFLEGDREKLFKAFATLSLFQFQHLSPMIPNLFRSIWEKGLESGDYTLKLCGAGGGGFLLGITHDFSKACGKLHPHQLREVLPL